MTYRLSAQDKQLVDDFIQQSENNSVILQQLALDASQILSCTEQRFRTIAASSRGAIIILL